MGSSDSVVYMKIHKSQFEERFKNFVITVVVAVVAVVVITGAMS